MSDEINRILDMQDIEITALQIIGKTELTGSSTLWQCSDLKPDTKSSFRLYIINDGSTGNSSPDFGYPVKNLKLVKRIIDEDYPKSGLIGSKKLRIEHRFALIFLIEFENGQLKILSIPNQLSVPSLYDAAKTIAFSEILSNDSGLPVPQQSTAGDICEKLIISARESKQQFFEYSCFLKISEFFPSVRQSESDNPGLKAQVLLKNLQYDADIQDTYRIRIDENNYVWTTLAEISLTEDIVSRLGIDQDIRIQGVPEYPD